MITNRKKHKRPRHQIHRRRARAVLIPSFIIATFSIFGMAACSSTGPAYSTASFDCDTPRQRGDWSRIDEKNDLGKWHEYFNGEGKRFRNARLTVGDVRNSMSQLFSGDAAGLVSAFDNLRLMLGDDIVSLSLVEMEFGTNSQKPTVTMVVDAVTNERQDRRGVIVRQGDNHYDLLQLRGAGDDSAVIKAQLRAFSSGCTPVQ